MRVVRIKKTGQELYVSGAFPKKKGDRFEATDVLETRPQQAQGCVIETFAGGQAFSCSRRSSVSYGHAGGTTKTYAFDPALHELTEELA